MVINSYPEVDVSYDVKQRSLNLVPRYDALLASRAQHQCYVLISGISVAFVDLNSCGISPLK